MAVSPPTVASSGYVDAEHTLQAELELVPDPRYSCPVADIEVDLDDIRFNAMDNQCRVDLVFEDGRVVRATDDRSMEDCFCSIFHQLDCVPHYAGTDNGVLSVSTYLTDHTDLRALVEGLRSVTASVTLTRLTAIEDETGNQYTILDESVLTEKEREALELAVGYGYYEKGDISLSSLAEKLDISTAAFSQRLRRAQSKLATAVVE